MGRFWINLLIGIIIFLLALVFSGILYMVGVVQLTPIPYGIWFLSSNLLFYLIYKIKFKNKNVLKFFLMRKWVNLNKYFYRLDKKITLGQKKLTPTQEKAIRLWKICLKDKNCILNCSISTRSRQIESGDIFILLNPSSTDYQMMNIFDISSDDYTKSNFYEVLIPDPYLSQIAHQFDNEMDHRMNNSEDTRREVIDNIMENMVHKQEEMVMSRKHESAD